MRKEELVKLELYCNASETYLSFRAKMPLHQAAKILMYASQLEGVVKLKPKERPNKSTV